MTLTPELLETAEAIFEELQARRTFVWDEDFNPSDFVLSGWAEDMHDDGVVTEAQIDAWLGQYA